MEEASSNTDFSLAKASTAASHSSLNSTPSNNIGNVSSNTSVTQTGNGTDKRTMFDADIDADFVLDGASTVSDSLSSASSSGTSTSSSSSANSASKSRVVGSKNTANSPNSHTETTAETPKVHQDEIHYKKNAAAAARIKPSLRDRVAFYEKVVAGNTLNFGPGKNNKSFRRDALPRFSKSATSRLLEKYQQRLGLVKKENALLAAVQMLPVSKLVVAQHEQQQSKKQSENAGNQTQTHQQEQKVMVDSVLQKKYIPLLQTFNKNPVQLRHRRNINSSSGNKIVSIDQHDFDESWLRIIKMIAAKKKCLAILLESHINPTPLDSDHPIRQIFEPPVDYFETKEEVHLFVELPGTRTEDVDIEILKNGEEILIQGFVMGFLTETFRDDEIICSKKEIRSGKFWRRIAIPVGIVPFHSAATMFNGVLHLRVQKKSAETSTDSDIVNSTVTIETTVQETD
ncbi:hypothetical protein HK100_006127 [Physocladia obscura]|uniref:SHSP domain-containing protein n=1 Tax=Physocladia obscura TaxID=109957 RepID=A0AAD5XKF9_9FUNG|nr:hypothetical protein HK100_006127 [Physocladia obscura]